MISLHELLMSFTIRFPVMIAVYEIQLYSVLDDINH
jgi:hypothetical protein